jgi:carboxyl-terminal processing protease
MKAAQRPQLPEDEAFVDESANIVLDLVKLQTSNPATTVSDPSVTVATKPAS